MSKPKLTRNRRSRLKGISREQVRELMLAFPGVQEGSSYATPAFKVNGKMLARFHPDGESLVLKVEYAAREVLMGANPTTFYVTDHYRCWPYMLVRLASVDPDELRQLFEEAWRNNASKRAVAAWDAAQLSSRSL